MSRRLPLKILPRVVTGSHVEDSGRRVPGRQLVEPFDHGRLLEDRVRIKSVIESFVPEALGRRETVRQRPSRGLLCGGSRGAALPRGISSEFIYGD